MSAARTEILRRIEAAVSRSAPVEIPRAYRGPSGAERGSVAVLDLMQDRLVDYKAVVHRVELRDVPAVIAAALMDAGIQRAVVPDGFPSDWLPSGPAWIGDEPPLTAAELDELDGVLTTCRIAVAETGTIVLDGAPGQGRRAVSLVPDYHLVVVRAEQVVGSVPDAVAELEPTNPTTWISGPSATSDIELQRVEGVHGPRNLVVLLVTA